MREVLDAIRELAQTGQRAALVTVVGARGSTPRKAGAKMLILATGESIGTIGGGCVEAEVWQEAKYVIKRGEPSLLTFNLTAEMAADSGMICGGAMDMFIEPVG